MSKYIIKNCPAFYRDFCDNTDYFCCDETDCLLKQIVDECRRGINYSQCNCGAVGNLINILNILDIQEYEK